MGRRYSANGDGWGSACRAADKLFLINGFSPGHLISLALGLKSNLTLCMSVNINKPLKKNKKNPRHSNVTHCVACGAGQESQFDGGVVVLLGEGQGQGEGDTSVARQKQGQEREKGKKREILPSSFQPSINAQPPVSKSLLMYRRRQGSSKITAHFLFFSPFRLYTWQPTLIHFPSTLCIVNRASAIYVCRYIY